MFSQEQAARVAEAWIRAGEQPRPGRPVARPATAFTVALSREAGSGGAVVAREVGRRLNWPVFDNELLTQISQDLHVDVHRLKDLDERPGSRLVECIEAFAARPDVTEVAYFRSLLRLLQTLGARGECVLVGRGAALFLPAASTLRVRVVATHESRVAAIAQERQLSPAEAARYVDSTDRDRDRFVKTHFHKDLADPLLYDLVLNASRFTVDECAGMVIEGLHSLQARKPGSE
jgi:cytidylate kinase